MQKMKIKIIKNCCLFFIFDSVLFVSGLKMCWQDAKNSKSLVKDLLSAWKKSPLRKFLRELELQSAEGCFYRDRCSTLTLKLLQNYFSVQTCGEIWLIILKSISSVRCLFEKWCSEACWKTNVVNKYGYICVRNIITSAGLMLKISKISLVPWKINLICWWTSQWPQL